MTLSALRRRLFERVGEDPASPQFWTAAEATAALNAAQSLLCLLTLTARKSASITTTSGALIDLLSLLPDVIVPLAIRASGVRVHVKTLAQLSVLNRAWMAAPGTAQHYTLLGANVLGLYPHQAQSLAVEYAYVPALMTGDSDIPTVKASLHDALVDYAGWRLRLKEGSGPLTEAEKDLKRFVDAAQAEAVLVRAELTAGQYDAVPPEITLDVLKGTKNGG